MVWLPIGPDFVFAPRNPDFRRLSLRNENGRQGLPNSIAIDPTDSNTIYITERPTSGGSSAFRTRNGGFSWTPIADELQIAASGVDPSCVAVNPSHPETIYLGTYSDRAVYVSSNRGQPGSWSARHFVGGAVRKLIVDSPHRGHAGHDRPLRRDQQRHLCLRERRRRLDAGHSG